jgi:hypothetical protein
MQVDRPLPGNSRIEQAFRTASDGTGASFDYLASTAYRESTFRPELKATTSTATGLFQFIEQTWLTLVKEEGPSLGLAAEAAQITRDAGGNHDVADPAAKRAILDLRKDPLLSSVMAGRLAERNAESLRKATGREPNQQDLYVAHVFGAAGGAKILNMMRNDPNAAAAPSFAKAAAANPAIFYAKDGHARTAGEIYDFLTRNHTTQPLGIDEGAERIAAGHNTFESRNGPKLSPAALADIVRAQAAATAAAEPLTGDPSRAGAAGARATRVALAEVSLPGAASGSAPPKGAELQGWRARASSDAFAALLRSEGDGAPVPRFKTPSVLGFGDAAPGDPTGGKLSAIATAGMPTLRASRYAASAGYGAPAAPLPVTGAPSPGPRPSRFSMAALVGAPSLGGEAAAALARPTLTVRTAALRVDPVDVSAGPGKPLDLLAAARPGEPRPMASMAQPPASLAQPPASLAQPIASLPPAAPPTAAPRTAALPPTAAAAPPRAAEPASMRRASAGQPMDLLAIARRR